MHRKFLPAGFQSARFVVESWKSGRTSKILVLLSFGAKADAALLKSSRLWLSGAFAGRAGHEQQQRNAPGSPISGREG